MENTIITFKLLGLNIIQHGLNILLQKMQLIVYPALSFIIQMGLWDKIYSLLVDLEIEKKLGKNCYFQGHIGKDLNSTHRVVKQIRI